ncbi:ankyrin repeat domain-containing protein, partial [Ideonella sp. B508-1]|uniref:ankyrin repeat domain-containing protein n=1 Tax=Ideonella sp. B508-1 TaxID=137716 RepID=UPI0003B7325C
TVVPVLLSWPGIALDAENAMGETPLMMAALKGRVEVMNTLIQRGARINKTGWTPLHYAAAGPSLDAVELLLAHDAALEAIAPNGNTPLMMAAGYGAIDSARLLLRRGADARPRNKGGRDAADLAKAADRLGLAQELHDAATAAR